jgi:hypothetical protein
MREEINTTHSAFEEDKFHLQTVIIRLPLQAPHFVSHLAWWPGPELMHVSVANEQEIVPGRGEWTSLPEQLSTVSWLAGIVGLYPVRCGHSKHCYSNQSLLGKAASFPGLVPQMRWSIKICE